MTSHHACSLFWIRRCDALTVPGMRSVRRCGVGVARSVIGNVISRCGAPCDRDEKVWRALS